MHAKRTIMLATLCAVLGAAGVAGCAPQTNDAAATPGQQAQAEQQQGAEREYTDEQKAIIAGQEGATYDNISLDAYPGKDYLDGLHDRVRYNRQHLPRMSDARSHVAWKCW